MKKRLNSKSKKDMEMKLAGKFLEHLNCVTLLSDEKRLIKILPRETKTPQNENFMHTRIETKLTNKSCFQLHTIRELKPQTT